MRLRVTAFVETFFDTTQAYFVPPVVQGVIEREKSVPVTRRAGRSFLKSAPEMRVFFIYVESFARPLLRRRTRIRRPVALALRLRKPCARERLRFFGCQLRFVDMTTTIPIFFIPTTPTNNGKKSENVFYRLRRRDGAETERWRSSRRIAAVKYIFRFFPNPHTIHTLCTLPAKV